ncbi:MAG: hypothetical protein K0U29_03195 [Gammaproteobacteria bacterium]|nr:hypothetical protein [Gammaproteobacteria bacterium]MCH9743917.1 hypothetical protein [Gammaproteobacteria bacterium]
MTIQLNIHLTNSPEKSAKHYYVSTIEIKVMENKIYLIDDGAEYHLKQNDIIHYQDLTFAISTDNKLHDIAEIPHVDKPYPTQTNNSHDPLEFLFKRSSQLPSTRIN